MSSKDLTMTAPMSQDLRQRIARAVAQGSSARQAAERFAVSPLRLPLN